MHGQPAVDPTSPARTEPARTEPATRRAALRLPASLMVAGQLLYIAITALHTSGDANDHHTAFAGYSGSGSWTAVHAGQFAGMAMFLAGLIGLFFALNRPAGTAGWAGRFGAAATVATLALYGVLQAVDGVALKQAVTAWTNAPDAEKAARFASAEAIRWLEWGVRSYQNMILGLALLLLAAAVLRAATWIPQPVVAGIALSGLAYLAQGWVVGTAGFSAAESMAIVAAFVLNVLWMSWLLVIALADPAKSRRFHR